jgi:rhamnose utilization protein RhaD (predicted bifunctional aldolase and dehydrogenase)
MRKDTSATNRAELTPLRELSARIGSDPLLTQASTGNISIKLGRCPLDQSVRQVDGRRNTRRHPDPLGSGGG